MSENEKTIVLIEWEDSNQIHGWRPDDCSQDDVAHCRIVGIVRAEDDKKITIAFGMSNCGSVLETITISKGSITNLKYIY